MTCAVCFFPTYHHSRFFYSSKNTSTSARDNGYENGIDPGINGYIQPGFEVLSRRTDLYAMGRDGQWHNEGKRMSGEWSLLQTYVTYNIITYFKFTLYWKSTILIAEKFVALDSHGYGCDYPNVWFKTFDDNPPQPQKEECVETNINYKEVHVCICTTDLCNNP